MRCDTCKHWKEPEDWDVKAMGMRQCVRIEPKWIAEDKIPEAIRDSRYDHVGDDGALPAQYVAAADEIFGAAKAVVNDGSQYCAELLTRPDFGCVLHQPKE